jgi:molybdenum cofactor cytidylyltransferase
LSSCGAILLAAGAATRMGRSKQLLSYRGESLVRHAAREALAAGFSPILVVVGARQEAVCRELAGLAVEIVENPQWASGMGSSIAAGMRHLPECEAVALLLADQPLVTAVHLRALGKLFTEGDAPVAAARYCGTLGVPAIFARALFPALAALEGHAGARSILQDPAYNALALDLPEAAIDIDTPEDYAALGRGDIV